MDDSPMIMTRSWEEVFRDLDQWEVVEKLRDLHLRSNAGRGPPGFARFCSPDIAHLIADNRGRIYLFHHFHYDADEGLNGGTNALWALLGGGRIAAAMAVSTPGLESNFIGTPFDWTKMLSWDSTRKITDAIDKLTNTNKKAGKGASKARAPARAPKKKPPTGKGGRPKKGARTKGKARAVLEAEEGQTGDEYENEDDEDEVDDDDDDEVAVVGFSMSPIVPVPGFVAATLMASYESDPIKLCLQSIEAIKERADADPDESRSRRLAEAASFLPRWILSVIVNARRAGGATPTGIETSTAYSKRADDWARDTHMRHLAVKARSVMRQDNQVGTPGRDDALRNLSSILERHATHTIATTPTPARTGFDAFPPSTKRMIRFVSERDEDGRVADGPVGSFTDILSLANVAHVQQHIQDFLRNTKGKDAMIPPGLGAAIRTASFISSVPDRPSAFSLFCCGPQTLYRMTSGSRDDIDYASQLIQMQLKTTDTTTGLSEKDIKGMTKLNFTIPRDFYELARLIENMAGITEILFGARSPLKRMLDEWNRFLTHAVGTTLATLRQLAHNDTTAACRLGWFVDRRMQQYLVVCAGAYDEIDVNESLLEFGPTRQQLEDGAFSYPLSEYLLSKLGRGSEAKIESNQHPNPTGGGQRPGRRNPPADAVDNPRGVLFPKDPNDKWQIFLDHASSSPISPMCCRWHLNGKCVRSCFLAAAHVALTAPETANVRAWVEQCRARMRRSAADAGPSKKTKLGPSESTYSRSTFVAGPSKWSTLIEPQHERILKNRLADAKTEPPFRHWTPTKQGTPSEAIREAPVQHPPPRTDTPPPNATPQSIKSKTRSRPRTPPTPKIRNASDPERTDGTQTDPLRGRPRPKTHEERQSDAQTTSKFSKRVPFPSIPVPDTAMRFPTLPVSRLAELLDYILHADQPRTHTPEFRFEWSTEAASHNLAVLSRHDYDLGKALSAQPFCALTPGSEFRPPAALAPLLSQHPLWPNFLERITEGAEFPLRDISEQDRITDVKDNLARGNHKSARGHEAKLISMLQDEVKRGWQLPLPLEATERIQGCEIAPLGMVVQNSIDEKGDTIDKYRLTHDQSFSPSGEGGRSVNDRVDDSNLTPARFGKAFSRLIYHINFLRQLYPTKRILLTKVDCKSAYRRVHLKPTTAVKSCTRVDELILVALRMTFGGSPNPSQWSDVSEVITDLANDLVRRTDWDPEVTQSPHQPLLESKEAIDNDAGVIDPDSPFAETEYFAVHYPDNDDLPRFDCYLDDIFGAFCEDDRAKSAAAIPLALHLVARPVTDEAESFPRDDILARSKFLAEARPAECKTILGWVVNTRRFTVSLPHEKFDKWTRSIDSMLQNHKRPVSTNELESTIGRLNHAAYVIPFARHFTGRLYKACTRSRAAGKARLTSPQLDDLVLWKQFLGKAREGISINKLVCRWPTRIIRVDACPQGIGGYCLESGIAWRFLIPEPLLGRATLNLLEFLAAFVGLIMECEVGAKPTTRDVFLSQGDSTSAAGWLAKSSFDDDCPMHLAMARSFARYCMDHDLCHYTQWFRGKDNKVADSLSRDFALDDDEVTKLIRDNCSPFVPQNFRITPLPKTLISRIGDLLRRRPKTLLLPTQPAQSEIAAGAGTNASSNVSVTTDTTLFSKDSDDENESKPSPVSRPPFGTEGFVLDAVRDLAREQCPTPFVPPSTVWLRPTGFTNLRAPSTTPSDESNPFWPCS